MSKHSFTGQEPIITEEEPKKDGEAVIFRAGEVPTPTENEAKEAANTEAAQTPQNSEERLAALDSRFSVYLEAKRLLRFIQYFRPINADLVPFNSICREFIGNSCFDYT